MSCSTVLGEGNDTRDWNLSLDHLRMPNKQEFPLTSVPDVDHCSGVAACSPEPCYDRYQIKRIPVYGEQRNSPRLSELLFIGLGLAASLLLLYSLSHTQVGYGYRQVHDFNRCAGY